MGTDQLPKWVYDVVIGLQRWADSHPDLHAEYYDAQEGRHRMQRVDDCGCGPLHKVPDQVKAQARVIAAYLEQLDPRTQQPGGPPDQHDGSATK